MKQVLKNFLLIAIAISVVTLISCNKDEEVPEVVASFIASVTAGSGEVSFDNTSENATTYAWDFGDGETSSLENPTHTYTEEGDYSVKLTASNAAGDSDTFTDDITVTIADETAPVITLVGDAPLCLNVGDTYTDPGATATDDRDGDITSSIVVGGDVVDPMTPGIYEVTYNVSDAEGNAAVEVTRGVVVNEVFDVEGNLVSNGDFSDGATGWFGNGGDPDIRDEGCDPYYFANPTSAGNSFDINVAQVIELTTGATYTLSFEASSDGSRTIIAGIGQNFGDYASASETVDLTTTPTEFVLEGLIPNFTAGANSRVFFDLGADVGVVVLDDISVVKTADPAPGEGPAVSAPVPSTDPGSVISIFSDTYTDLGGINYDPNWGQSGHTLVNTTYDPGDGNFALAYPNFNYQGTDLGGNQDLSATNTLHIDIWVPSGTDRQVKVSPISATGVTEVLVPVTLTPGSWSSVDIPIGSFTDMTWDAIKELKFDGQFNGDGSANTAPFDIYLDNIYFWNDPSGGGGGGTPGDELTVNGDFETGDATGWTSFAVDNNGIFTVTDAQAKDGTYSGLLKADVDAAGGAASFPLVKQANIGIGTVTAGATVTVSFDLYGSLAGAGGVVFAELFSELAGEGVSKSEILGGGPLFPSNTWTNYSYTTTLGDDVGGGITLQLKADCGANGGCITEAYFDNVSVKLVE